MSTIRRLATEIEAGLRAAHPTLRKTVITKLALAVGAVLEAQTPNTAELANLLPLDTERQDMREQWLRRLLKNPLLSSAAVLEPWARQALAAACQHGETILLSMDQTDLGNRFAILMISLGVGHRALPLAWAVEAGPANLGFTTQQALLERVRAWLPAGAEVLLCADRFYPSVDLFQWLAAQPGWHYRLRLKGNLNVDPGFGEITTTGALAQGHSERYLSNVWLFNEGVPTNLAIWHEPGHPEPWIIAMNDPPNRATVQDYACRWGIEPMFSDFKSRGFQLEDTQLQAADRLDRLLLIMTLAMYWCVRVGQEETRDHPTPLEKKIQAQTDPDHWTFRKLARSALSWFTRGLRVLERRLQMELPLPPFYPICPVMRN
jgi:hypothetical protein